MQSKKEYPIDTRKFTEMWQTFSKQTKQELAVEVFVARLATSSVSLYNWGAGRNRPQVATQRCLARIVTKVCQVRCSADTLFPKD